MSKIATIDYRTINKLRGRSLKKQKRLILAALNAWIARNGRLHNDANY